MPRSTREQILRKLEQSENLIDNTLGHLADTIQFYNEAEQEYNRSYQEYKDHIELAAQGLIVAQDLIRSFREEKA